MKKYSGTPMILDVHEWFSKHAGILSHGVVQGDQASIVGGAIEFVKELEHLLHCLQNQKRRRAYSELTTSIAPASRPVNSILSDHQLSPQLIPAHSQLSFNSASQVRRPARLQASLIV